MTHLVTGKGVLKCAHGGIVVNRPTEAFVFLDGARLLVDSDPELKAIVGCPIAPPVKLCTATLGAKTVGYSDLLFVAGKGVVLGDFVGYTDGVVPGTIPYSVASAGQGYVSEAR